jgi:hypothetical protein
MQTQWTRKPKANKNQNEEHNVYFLQHELVSHPLKELKESVGAPWVTLRERPKGGRINAYDFW